MILNISNETFGGAVRNGDLIAVCNVVEYFRNTIPDIQFHMLPSSINSADHCKKFHKFLIAHTNYFSNTPGKSNLNWKKVNLWDFRDCSGDLVKIPGLDVPKKKIVIFPLFDAQYNTYRNWPTHVYFDILRKYNTPEFVGYEKIVCSSVPLDVQSFGYVNSTNFEENLYHILTSSVFVGGDTGTTHFAFALTNGPEHLEYVGSSRALVHTLPFYLMQGKGVCRNYWLDMEGSTFNNQ